MGRDMKGKGWVEFRREPLDRHGPDGCLVLRCR